MSPSPEEAIALTTHRASGENAVDDKRNANRRRPSSETRDRLKVYCQGVLIRVSRWLKNKKKAIDVREAGLLAGLLAAIVCVCTLPGVLYFALVTGGSRTDDVSEILNCTQSSIAGSSFADCSPYSWGVVYPSQNGGAACNAESYAGSVCSQQLLAWQECSSSRGGDQVLLLSAGSGSRSQQEAERDAAQLLHFLKALGSPECQKVVAFLACQSSFPLCDCESGQSYLASREECERVSTVECEEEWTTARGYGISLPNCTDLPEADKESSGDFELSQVPNVDLSNLTCHEDFFESNFTCLPRCADWKQDPPAVSSTIQNITISSYVIMFCASLMLVVMYILRRKTILKFPMVMLLYAGTASVVFALLSLVSAVGGGHLYCSSEDLIHTVANPTAFCIFQGVIEVFLMTFITLVCFFHISLLFYDIVFPLRAEKSKKYFKWVHLTLLIVATVVPLIIAVSGLIPGEGEYTLSRFPPIDCDGESVNFYTVVLPFNIIATIGICMFVVIVWIVFKKKGSEKKVFIIFVYYIALVVIVMGRNEEKLATSSELTMAINDYFVCEAPGYVESKCDRESFEKYSNPSLECLFHIMLMLLPVVNLIFVTNFHNMKRNIQVLCSRRKNASNIEEFENGFLTRMEASSPV